MGPKLVTDIMTHAAIGNSPTPIPKPRVLIVDDDATYLGSFARLLSGANVAIDCAHNGADALALFERGEYQAIVSDVVMPDMNGHELLRAIRERDLDIPVIFVTGEPSVEDASAAMELGAMRYLTKPVEGDRLVATIDQAVNLHRMAMLKRRALIHLGEPATQSDRPGMARTFEAALEKLFMVYQPIVRWSSRTMAGHETLVRSGLPEVGNPGALFDLAERLGRVDALGRRIRELAPAPFLAGAEIGRLFINLHVRDLLDETLFDPDAPLARMADRVVLEITERAALEEVRDARQRIARLREMGFQIAVDDLGAGYAGLNSFALLEPNVVKLDMTLVRGVDASPTKQKLVRSMSTLCQDMGMEVVAEGIETVEERDTLVGLGCDLLQGYLFAKPAYPFPEVRW